MMQKAIYLCCIAEPWIGVAKDLESQGIKPVYCVHWKVDEKRFENAFDEPCHLQSLENAWKGLGFPKDLKPKTLDEPEYQKIAWYELNALKMMDRLDPLGNQFGFQERCYFFQDLVGYWLACIEKFGVDVVISPSIPHRVFDYALYVACKMKEVKFLMFQMVPFGSTSVIIENIDAMGDEYAFDMYESNCMEPSPEIKEKINQVRKDYSEAIPSYMVSHKVNQRLTVKKAVNSVIKPIAKIILFSLWKKKEPNTYWVKKGKMPAGSSYSWFDFYITVLMRALKVVSLEKKYKRLVKSQMPEKFVLLALHYQPEETSCPTGGTYADQITILKILDEVLPADIGIVVKEHRTQFYTHRESASGRDASFYHRLKTVSSDRVVFSSVNTSPFDLIDKAVATATISGTIGWESAIRGTPTLVFGRAWYENMPRVHKVKSRQDLLDIIPNLESEKNLDLNQLIIGYHGHLEEKFIRAKHYKALLNNSDVDFSESESNIINALSNRLVTDI
jgi:hypothetical protein